MGCSSLTVRSADAVSPSRKPWIGARLAPTLHLGDARRCLGARVLGGRPRAHWGLSPGGQAALSPQDSPLTLGVARPAGGAPEGTCTPGAGPQPQVTPGRAQLAGFILAAESRLPASAVPQSPAPPRALPARFPSQFLSRELSRARLPPPSLPVHRLQTTSLQLVPSPNSRAGFLNPVLPAAPRSVVILASAGQPPLEPRGQRGGAGVLG